MSAVPFNSAAGTGAGGSAVFAVFENGYGALGGVAFSMTGRIAFLGSVDNARCMVVGLTAIVCREARGASRPSAWPTSLTHAHAVF